MISRFVLALAAAAVAFAQPSSTATPATQAQMRVNMLSSRLNLSDAQKASAVSIFTAAATNSQTIRTNLETNHTALEGAVKGNNTASIDTLSAQSGTLSGQLTAINSKAEAAFYALLTTDQKAIFDASHRGGEGRGGPGGPGRPGGPQGRKR